MDMSSMSMSTSSNSTMAGMDAVDMNMVFFLGQHTSLWSSMWTPMTTGAYAGTCIFLIVLATIYRGLFAAKSYLEYYTTMAARKRRFVVVADKTPASERASFDSDAKFGVLTVNGVEESVRVVEQMESTTQPWRFSVDLPRAALVTVIVGVGYLLMLAVMTMNVGYFLSVVAGSFVGELAFGRFTKELH